MYLKYTVGASSTRAQIQNEIGDLLTEVITPANAVYGTAVVDGTGPTAGTYTRTSTSTDKHLSFTKKHAQYDAATMPAEMILKVFGNDAGATSGSYTPTLQISDKLGSNVMGEYFPGNYSHSANSMSQVTGGTEYHFIFNDTTFVMQVLAAQTSSAANQVYAGTIWSDFEITAYDEYAIGENPLYYPGCAMIHQARDPNNSSVGAGTNGFFGAYRFQYQNQYDGAFANSSLYTSRTDAWNFIGFDDSRRPGAYFSSIPCQTQPFFQTWGPSGSSIAMVPLQMDGQGPTHFSSTTGPSSPVGADSRWHNVMLNSYRISTLSGVTGDYIETSDNTRYYMFSGHRTMRVQPETGNYNSVNYQALYAFPRNNVVMP